MKIQNFSPTILKQQTQYLEYKDQNITSYQQVTHILGATIKNSNEIIYVINDKKDFDTKEAHTKVMIMDIETGQTTMIQKLRYAQNGFEFLNPEIFYNAELIISLQGSKYITDKDDIIIGVAESQDHENVLVALNNRILVLNKYLVPQQQLDLGVNVIECAPLEQGCDHFLAMTISEEQQIFYELMLKNGNLSIIKQKTTDSFISLCSSEPFDSQQLKFSPGVYINNQQLILYGNYCQFGNHVNTLGCYDVALNTCNYMYATTSPVLRVHVANLMCEVDGIMFDLIAFADTAGFLTVTLGASQENIHRLICLQTNMWVKNIQIIFEEDSNGQVLYRHNTLLEGNCKFQPVKVGKCKIFVFGSSELIHGDSVLQSDQFSVITLDIRELLSAVSSRHIQIDDTDEESYLDYKVNQSISQHTAANELSSDDEWYKGEGEEGEEQDEQSYVDQTKSEQPKTDKKDNTNNHEQQQNQQQDSDWEEVNIDVQSQLDRAKPLDTVNDSDFEVVSEKQKLPIQELTEQKAQLKQSVVAQLDVVQPNNLKQQPQQQDAAQQLLVAQQEKLPIQIQQQEENIDLGVINEIRSLFVSQDLIAKLRQSELRKKEKEQKQQEAKQAEILILEKNEVNNTNKESDILVAEKQNPTEVISKKNVKAVERRVSIDTQIGIKSIPIQQIQQMQQQNQQQQSANQNEQLTASRPIQQTQTQQSEYLLQQQLQKQKEQQTQQLITQQRQLQQQQQIQQQKEKQLDLPVSKPQQTEFVFYNKNNDELKIQKIYTTSLIVLFTYKNLKFILDDMPQQILLTSNFIFFAMQFKLLAYDLSGTLMKVVVFEDTVQCIAAPKVVSSPSIMFQESPENECIVVTKSTVVKYSSEEKTTICNHFNDNFHILYDQALFALSNGSIYILDKDQSKFQLLCEIQFLCELIPVKQLQIILKSSQVPQQLYQQCIQKQQQIRQQCKAIQNIDIGELQHQILNQHLVKQGVLEMKILKNRQMFQAAALEFRQAITGQADDIIKMQRNFVLQEAQGNDDVLQEFGDIFK